MNFLEIAAILNCFIVIFVKCQLMLEVPDYALSFCSYRVGYPNSYGCEINYRRRNTGTLIVVRTLIELQFQIVAMTEEPIVIAMPVNVFADKSTIEEISNKFASLVGIIVFEPAHCSQEFCDEVFKLTEFNEIPICNNKYDKHFTVKRCKYLNSLGNFSYFYNMFTFPVLMLKHVKNYQEILINCYENYNFPEPKGYKCKVEISGYYMTNVLKPFCINDKFQRQKILTLGKFENVCADISGQNIYITASNKPMNSSFSEVVLIVTKMDSISMFERSAHGTQELYFNLGIMLALLGNIISLDLKADKEVLFGFIDNDSEFSLGTLRMIYDLKMNFVSDGYKNISDKNIILIVNLKFGMLKDNSMYVFLYHCERNEKICDNVRFALLNSGSPMDILFYNMRSTGELWLTAINVPYIELTDTILDYGHFQNSFLDKYQPIISKNTASVITTIVKVINNVMDSGINPTYNFKIFTAGNITQCLYNISCGLFDDLIGPKEKQFYNLYATPFISQSFVNSYVEIKQAKYYDRLSHFIMKLVIFFFTKPLKNHNEHSCPDLKDSNTYLILVKDIPICYQGRAQILTQFNPYIYMTETFKDPKFQANLNFTNLYSDLIYYHHLTKFTKTTIDIYVSLDSDLYTILTVMATFTGSLTVVAAIFIHRNINSIIPDEIF